MPPPPILHDWAAADQVLRRVEALLAPACPPEDVYYGWEPWDLHEFIEGLTAARHALGTAGTFLDAGCGIGTKLALAQYLGWTAAGIERHEPYADVARRVCPAANLWIGDAADFPRYDDFDLVYSYRLCVRDEDQLALEARIMERMRPGALAFFPKGLRRDLGEQLGPWLWRV